MEPLGAPWGLQSRAMTTATRLESDEIGAMIRRARLAKDMTKADAARAAGVSRRTWHEIEEGQRVGTTARTLACFDQALGFDEGTLWALTSRPAER